MPDPAIICLTSIPPRFHTLGPVLESLLAQDLAPLEIRLHIPHRYRRFPDWDGSLPPLPAGIRLIRCETDRGPADKVLPAVADLSGQDVDLLYCDDDWIYPAQWHRRFAKARQRWPGKALGAAGYQFAPLIAAPEAQRARRVSRLEQALLARTGRNGTAGPRYRNAGQVRILGGWGGVMVRPDFFDAAVFDLPPVLWSVDDVWLSGHLTRRGIPLWVSPDLLQPRAHDPASHCAPLLRETLDGHGRAAADHACVLHFRERYGIWPAPAPDRLRQMARKTMPTGLRRMLWWLAPGD